MTEVLVLRVQTVTVHCHHIAILQLISSRLVVCGTFEFTIVERIVQGKLTAPMVHFAEK